MAKRNIFVEYSMVSPVCVNHRPTHARFVRGPKEKFAIYRQHQISSNIIHIQNLIAFLEGPVTYSHNKAHKPFGQLQIEGSNGNISRASLASLHCSWKKNFYIISPGLNLVQ